VSVTPVVVDPVREEAELVAYLGDDYDRERLVHYEHGLEAEAAAIGDEATLYRTSQAYLYNLTAFAMTQTKAPYLAALAAAVPAGARVLDYGCGIGSDGLALLEAGYQVAFADFDNPSVRYLRWRLAHRSLSAPIYDLERDDVPGGFDLAYAFDVIEHVEDPFAFLAALERRAGLVLVNFLDEGEDDTRLHRVLPIRRLLLHAASHRLRHYRLHYGRSHLVLYESRRARGLGRLRSLAILGAGRLASR
jgi:SAM-dependent methyltransferase